MVVSYTNVPAAAPGAQPEQPAKYACSASVGLVLQQVVPSVFSKL